MIENILETAQGKVQYGTQKRKHNLAMQQNFCNVTNNMFLEQKQMI